MRKRVNRKVGDGKESDGAEAEGLEVDWWTQPSERQAGMFLL